MLRQGHRLVRVACGRIAFGLYALVLGPLPADAAPAPGAEDAHNMVLVAQDSLQGRSAYQPSIHRQGKRYIAYIGHHGGEARNALTGKIEPNGTSIVDVTDPTHPKYLFHIPGAPGDGEAGGAQMTRVCDGKSLPHADRAKTYLLRSYGQTAHEIYDVTDPSHPKLVSGIDGFRDTHKSWWECDTGIAYLVAGVEGWRAKRITQVMDLSDPAHPIFIRDFGLPGQEPGSTGAVPPDLHGPISLGPQGNRIYFAYGPGGDGIVQIVDRAKLLKGPKEPTPANLLYPQVGALKLSPLSGAHTTFPLPKMPIKEFAHDGDGRTRDFVLVTGEALKENCAGPRQMVLFVDVTREDRPMVVSTYTVPEKSGNFCTRGGRFGAHASSESFAPVYYKKLAFISFFNAGVRALDIRDPYHPHEIGYYIPAVTDATCAKESASARCKKVIQTNNVETDERGYIYIVDRSGTGLAILRLTWEPDE